MPVGVSIYGSVDPSALTSGWFSSHLEKARNLLKTAPSRWLPGVARLTTWWSHGGDARATEAARCVARSAVAPRSIIVKSLSLIHI